MSSCINVIYLSKKEFLFLLFCNTIFYKTSNKDKISRIGILLEDWDNIQIISHYKHTAVIFICKLSKQWDFIFIIKKSDFSMRAKYLSNFLFYLWHFIKIYTFLNLSCNRGSLRFEIRIINSTSTFYWKLSLTLLFYPSLRIHHWGNISFNFLSIFLFMKPFLYSIRVDMLY